MPDVWGDAPATGDLASSQWREVLDKIPSKLKRQLGRHVADVNTALAAACAHLHRTTLIDRSNLLRPGDIHEHTHLSRRALHAIADAVLSAITT